MARLESAGQIINDTALEVGLVPVSDPYSTQDESFTQLTGLLNSAGREMIEMYSWEILQKPFTIVTQAQDSGSYDLPSDFDHMINQTGWNQSARTPVTGPLSVQMWSYLQGMNLGSYTLYASFILSENKIVLYPSPPPTNVTISFYYISRNWVLKEGNIYADRPSASSDIILYDPILMVKFLKVKFLSAKGFDIAVASRDFDMTFQARTGYDKGAPILNAAGNRQFPYLNMFGNVPFSGFGL